MTWECQKDACGPCKSKDIVCVDTGGKKAYSCLYCTQQKIKCNPLNKKAERRKEADEEAERLKKKAGKKPQEASKAQAKSTRDRSKKRSMVGEWCSSIHVLPI